MMFLFSKYHGAGNDFIMVDDRKEQFPTADSAYIRFLCDRNRGVGADGVIVLQSAQRAHFRMRIFNSDGLEAQICGNGLRCVHDFARRLHLVQSSSQIEIGDRIVQCESKGEEITVDLGAYRWMHAHLSIPPLDVDVVHTGVPHAVAFVESHDLFSSMASDMRSHPLLGSEGANVNFAIFENGKFYTRTCERGAGETLSCGSGAAAVAVAAKKRYQLPNPFIIVPRSGEELKVLVNSSSVQLCGKATFVFHGSIMYK